MICFSWRLFFFSYWPPPPPPALKGTFSLSLPVSMELAPTARLLLFAVFADGEVAADVDVFTIEKCLRHQVSA